MKFRPRNVYAVVGRGALQCSGRTHLVGLIFKASQRKDGARGRALWVPEGPLSKLFHLYLKDVRVGADALALAAEMLNVFVQEAASRATRQAQLEELPVVDLEHIEKILPQLLLDF